MMTRPKSDAAKKEFCVLANVNLLDTKLFALYIGDVGLPKRNEPCFQNPAKEKTAADLGELFLQKDESFTISET